MTNIFNKLTQIFLLFFLTDTVILAAPASDGLIDFGGFDDGGNNLTNADFVLSGTINGVAGNMEKDSGVAFLDDSNLQINKACAHRLEANGTTTASFELTAISANEYDAAQDYINVSLVGIKLDTTEIFSDNTITGDTNAKDTYDTATLGLTNFSGVQLTAIEIRYNTQNTILSEACGGVDFNSFTIANAQAPVTTKAEPTNHPTNFTATPNSSTQITTAWTDATGTVTPDTYLVMCNKTGTFTSPVDATAQTNDTDCSDGSGVQNIAQGEGTVAWTGLDTGTQYYYKIFPYTNTGSDVNYKTDATPATANATTTVVLDEDATLTSSSGITEPIDLPTTANATTNAVSLFDFTLTDGGSADGLSTDVTQLVLHTSGTGDFSKVTWRLSGTNASQVVGVYNLADNTLTFSGLSLSITDGTNETYIVNGFFNDNSSITDNHTYLFSIDGASDASGGSDVTVDPNKTQMAADGGGF